MIIISIYVLKINKCHSTYYLVLQDGVKNLAKTPAKLWKDGLIYYEIDKNFSVDRKRFIVKALNNIMTFSCVRFRRRTHNQTPYIVYKESPNGKS
jgi:Astacin (Peptidase family M12A).